MLAALTVWLTLTVPTAPLAPPSSTVLEAIDLRYEAGAIDARTRLLYRVAALKRPDLLPRALRDLQPGPTVTPWMSGTYIAREAWQWVKDNQAWHGELHNLLQPPPDKDFWFDSEVLPIRVSYQLPQHEAIARSVLEAAEYSWFTEVDDYGFMAPPIEPGVELYRIYIEDAGPTAAGYLSPYESNPDTSWNDCFSYIVIDPSSGDLNGVVAHEMSHATQAAMDCGEITTFWENTSTYIMSQVYASAWDYTLYTMAYFQELPGRPLDYMYPSAAPFYEYGGALLLLYLTDAYAAPGEGPAMVADIWTAAMQDDNSEFNEPDYFDAIASVVATRGGSTDFDDTFMDFSEARFFVGNNDDGQHITDAHTYGGAEVALAARHWTSSLPVFMGHVDENMRPQEYGVSYVLLNLGNGYPYGFRIRFNGSDRTRWRVRLVRTGGGLDTTRQEMELDPETGEGNLELDATGHHKMLMVVAALGPPGWDPDSGSSNRFLFVYDIDPILPPLAVTALTPSPVEQGRMAVDVELIGEGFVDGADFDVSFDDPGLHVAAVNSVDVTRVELVLSVSRDTPIGPHDVTVTNRDGTTATGVGLLTISERTTDVGPDPAPNAGCGCQTSGKKPPGFPMVLALLGLLLFLRRRL